MDPPRPTIFKGNQTTANGNIASENLEQAKNPQKKISAQFPTMFLFTPLRRNSPAHKYRHRVNGVGRGGGQTDFNQILTRFHGIRLKSG